MAPHECTKYRVAAVELLYAALCVERRNEQEDADMGVERLIPHVWNVLINASKYVNASLATLSSRFSSLSSPSFSTTTILESMPDVCRHLSLSAADNTLM